MMYSDNHCRCHDEEGGDLGFILKANAIVLIIFIIVAITMNHQNMVKDNLWLSERNLTTDASMGDFYFLGEDTYEKDKWSYTELSNGDYLINPFEMHLLCHIKSIPQNGTLLNEISTKEIIQAKQEHTRLIVKPMAVSWQDTDAMIEKAKSCPDIDMSGEYLKYRGHNVVELIALNPDTNKNMQKTVLKQ
jgi:hypothetical protein